MYMYMYMYLYNVCICMCGYIGPCNFKMQNFIPTNMSYGSIEHLILSILCHYRIQITEFSTRKRVFKPKSQKIIPANTCNRRCKVTSIFDQSELYSVFSNFFLFCSLHALYHNCRGTTVLYTQLLYLSYSGG